MSSYAHTTRLKLYLLSLWQEALDHIELEQMSVLSELKAQGNSLLCALPQINISVEWIITKRLTAITLCQRMSNMLKLFFGVDEIDSPVQKPDINPDQKDT